MGWRQRERWFYWGAPLAIGPALAFLPALVFLVIEPRVRHAALLAAILAVIFAVSEFVGIRFLVRCCLERPFNLLTLLSFGALLVLMVIAIYTGIFLAALAAHS